MTQYTINANPEFNSLEIIFNSKPSETIRNTLKDLHFRWHNVKKCWYGYKDLETVKKALENATGEKPTAKTTKAKSTEKVNKYGVKVGDIFSASWGYEQTNVDFFQVIALVGECSVRVREVYPTMIDEQGISGMSANRTYKLTNELLPPAKYGTFIKDQENGDLKRIKAGWGKTTEEQNASCFFNLSSYANAYKCNGDTVTEYESWYA